MTTLISRAPFLLPRIAPRLTPIITRRKIQTLEKSPHVYIFPNPRGPPNTHILTLLPTQPPKPDLALGTTTAIPPEPETFTENPHFIQLLQSVVAEYATQDPDVKVQASAYASTGGSAGGSGGSAFPGQSQNVRNASRGGGGRNRGRAVGGGGGAGGGGAGGASAQGGMGGGGVGGFVHVADQRNPPDWGRIAWPEDMLGSVEVDGRGEFVGATGGYQRSGTYRICTRDGVLHLSPFLLEKLVAGLKELEKSL